MLPVLGVIPARYGSKRFPGKPLALINGKPMIECVVRQAKKALPRVVVATDDRRIYSAVKKFGGEVVMTSRHCKSGTDRVWEAARKIPARYYVNVQGDEPFIDPSVIRRTVKLAKRTRSIATAAVGLKKNRAFDPHQVKVVMDKTGRALYFSRSVIPYSRDGIGVNVFKHLGLYVYPNEALKRFVAWPVSRLEKEEKLEQLRALYHGEPIYVAVVKHDSIGIDTPADLKKAQRRRAK